MTSNNGRQSGEVSIRMFDPEGRVYFLGEDFLLKEELEYKLNVRTIHIGDIDTLIQQVNETLEAKAWATYIFTDSVNTELKAVLDDIVNVFNSTINRDLSASVIELAMSGTYFSDTYPNVFKYATVDSLADDKLNERRGRVIEKAKKEDNEYKMVYESLLLEIDNHKDTISKNRVKINNLEETLKRAEERLNKLSNIETEYSNRVYKLNNEIAALQDFKTEKTSLLTHQDNLINNLQVENGELRTKNSSLEMDNLTYKASLEKTRNDVDTYRRKIKALEEDISKLKRERDNLINSSLDEEYVQELVRKIAQLEDDIKAKIDEITKKSIENSELVHEVTMLESNIEKLRTSDDELLTSGLSTKFDEAVFNSVSLHYFKIKHEMKYLKSYLDNYVEILRDEKGVDSVKLIIIKNNEGLDNIYFEGVPLHNNLEGARKVYDNTFRLIPSAKMFTGYEEFQDGVTDVVVLDYTDTNKNYLTTYGFVRNFVCVIDSKLISKLKYDGMPISQDSNSKLSLSYDPEIGASKQRDIKKQLVKFKVRRFMENIDVL